MRELSKRRNTREKYAKFSSNRSAFLLILFYSLTQDEQTEIGKGIVDGSETDLIDWFDRLIWSIKGVDEIRDWFVLLSWDLRLIFIFLLIRRIIYMINKRVQIWRPEDLEVLKITSMIDLM